MKPGPEGSVAVQCRTVLGEAPLWHSTDEELYWIDVRTGELFRHDPAGGSYSTYDIGSSIRGMTVQRDGALLLFMEDGSIRRFDDGETRTVIRGIPALSSVSFNDVVADPAGRVYCGVRATEERAGYLYRLDPDGSFTPIRSGIGAPNGLGFSPDQKTLYFTDSGAYRIFAFDYDPDTGAVDGERIFASISPRRGFPLPDGLTVDASGSVWSAQFGHGIVRYSPDGEVESQCTLPAKTVTSVAFGGNDLDTLFVTSATEDFDLDDVGVNAGRVFRLDFDCARGATEFESRIDV